MSLATRCSACGARFLVTDGELSAAGGLVRCGRCGEVFDGAQCLTDAPRQVEGVAASDLPAFLRDADPVERRRDMRARSAWGFAALVLLTVLALQAALHFRDQAATRWPASQPLLAAACRIVAGCQVEAPRSLDAIGVEDSSLSAVRNSSAYRLSLLLRNRADFAIAMPAVDLTLTDSGGTLVARRVLMPADFGEASRILPAGAEAPLNTTFTTSIPVSGYRVYIFYP